MAQLRIFQPTSAPVEVPAAQTVSGGAIGVRYRSHHPGQNGELNLFEVALPPGHRSPPHAHALDEIIAVIEGELHFGNQVLTAGSSVYVPGETLYGFRAGPAGCRFLNFRATSDPVTMSKEEFGNRMRGRPHEPEGRV